MTSWVHRVGAFFGGNAAGVPNASHISLPASTGTIVMPRASTPHALAQHAAMPRAATPHALAPVEAVPPFFEWLLGTGPLIDMALRVSEQRMLMRLDSTLASDATRNALVPRAAAVIPQLLNSLRDESQSSEGLALRVAKDPLLVAEVIRLANTAHHSARTTGGVADDLPRAIARIGTQGLRRAIAKVVLRPIFDAQADPLSARTAPKLWLHSEAKAAQCLRLCRAAAIDPFDGYLAGLMHNIGRTAALRVIGRSEPTMPTHFSRAFVQAFESRCDSFFATLVKPWELTDSITALAGEMLTGGLAASNSPLGQALREAERNASLEVIEASEAPAAALA